MSLKLISEIEDDANPLDLAERFFNDSDIIIIEGFKDGNIKKIEVIGDTKEDPLFHNDNNIKILVTDKTFDCSLPVFKRDDVDGVVEAIENVFGETCTHNSTAPQPPRGGL